MAIAQFDGTLSPNAAAGPSRIPTKRTANFEDSSDEGDDFGPLTLAKSKRRTGTDRANGDARQRGGPIGAAGSGGGDKRSRLERAEQLFEKRRELPFYQARKDILEEIINHDTTIIIGETGCGKSTQLPQLLRSHSISKKYYSPDVPDRPGWRRGPSIAITQPRRLPTIALANRVAEEVGCPLGKEVGYTVRFEDASDGTTKIRYMTEGVLMRELANGDRTQRSSRSNGSTGDVELPNGVNHKEGSNGSQSQATESSASASGQGQQGAQQLNLLLKYDIIIIDEAHERTLNTDFLCGTLKRVQRIREEMVRQQGASNDRALAANGEVVKSKGKGKEAGRPVTELKIVVMSATLDPAKFQRFFETGRDCLLIKGRMHDVATRHSAKPVDDYIESAAKNVLSIHQAKDKPGDVLVFMPGSEEIENCCALLRRASDELPDTAMKLEILPLYAALPATAQTKIFAPLPANTRRVVVATNIAETSITIPGICHVIDTGFKKEKEYIFQKTGSIEHLALRPISQAAAWQRTGRAGRERPGDCYRLYSKKAFGSLQPFDVPEIQRCNLASAMLQLIAMGIDPREFEYIDFPGHDPIAAALHSLVGLGAITSPTTITSLGRSMLFYPLDPSHARILLASFELGCPLEMIDILSLTVSGPIWSDRASERDATAAAKEKFGHKEGDHMTGLNVFRAYLSLSEEQGISAGRWCRDNSINQRTLNSAIKVRDQLRDLVERDGREWNVSCGDETGLVPRALLQGMFPNTAIVQADGSYKQTLGNMTVKIHPSSVLMSKRVPAIIYDELTITSSVYARNVSSFEQQWLGDLPIFRRGGLSIDPPNKPSRL